MGKSNWNEPISKLATKFQPSDVKSKLIQTRMSMKEPQFWPFSTPLCSESKIGACDFLSQKHGTEGEVDVETKSGKSMHESQL